MNRVQVARAAFAISASGGLLAIALLGAGPFEDPSHPSALPPWAIEPELGRDGAPIMQTPLQTVSESDRFAATGGTWMALWAARRSPPSQVSPSPPATTAPQPPLVENGG